jgi:hypothetical protein
MSIWRRLFGGGSSTPPRQPSGRRPSSAATGSQASGDTYNCRSCGRKTSGTYLIVGADDPFEPPYYGGNICDSCAEKLGALR